MFDPLKSQLQSFIKAGMTMYLSLRSEENLTIYQARDRGPGTDILYTENREAMGEGIDQAQFKRLLKKP